MNINESHQSLRASPEHDRRLSAGVCHLNSSQGEQNGAKLHKADQNIDSNSARANSEGIEQSVYFLFRAFI